MRILADTRLLGRGETSGIHEYTSQILRSFFEIGGHEYVLFNNGFRKTIPLNSQIAQYPNNKLIDWHIPNRLLDFSTKFFGFPAIDDFITSDVVFSPHFNILKTKKTPRVITFHDLSFLHHPEFFSWKQKFWHWLQDYQKQAGSAAKIIAVSEFTKSDLVNLLKVPAEKIEVVYSGIGSEFRKLDKEKVNQFARFHGFDAPVLLYLGTLEPRKNIAAVIRAFNIIKEDANFADLKLVLAGRPGWMYQDVLKEATKSRFAKDIVFWGKIRAEDRVLLYNSARAFVYPSFFEGFGFPPLEAQACGCPAIVANRTSLPEVVGDSALLIDPWRIDYLADAIKSALCDSALRDKLINAGFENAKKFSWQTTARKTLKILSNV